MLICIEKKTRSVKIVTVWMEWNGLIGILAGTNSHTNQKKCTVLVGQKWLFV